MPDGLTEADAAAQVDAISILRAAGFEVERVTDVEPSGNDGVEFDLHVRAPTRYSFFQRQVEAMKEVVEDTPEIGQGLAAFEPEEEQQEDGDDD